MEGPRAHPGSFPAPARAHSNPPSARPAPARPRPRPLPGARRGPAPACPTHARPELRGTPDPRPSTCLAQTLHGFCRLDLWGSCPAKRCPITEHVGLNVSLVSSLLHKLLTQPSRTLPATNPQGRSGAPAPTTARSKHSLRCLSAYSRGCLLHTPSSHCTFPSQRPFPFQCHFRLELSSQSPCRGIPLTESV